MTACETIGRKPAAWNFTPVEGVRKIIAVASGKGGVGKSTVSAMLALAAAASGKRAGLLDADIYGPSVPRLMGLSQSGQPEIVNGKMVPLQARGIQCMSMGFITGDAPAILRGPMISKTLHQLLRGTSWGMRSSSEAVAPLDILFVDMPPGTGDIHLSMAQAAPLDGAIIVTTPQQVALDDARKCALMFGKVGIPVLGVVENMSGEVFGHGGGAKLAAERGVKLLGEIPLDARIRESGDAGEVFVPEVLKQIVASL